MTEHDKERQAHGERVASIQRRGLHDRVISKLHYWKSLECNGYDLQPHEVKEVVNLTTTLTTVRAEMTAAGQPPGDYALLLALKNDNFRETSYAASIDSKARSIRAARSLRDANR